ncbi:MAG: N-acetylglucosamine-6-phosphate deacetylase [Planctomycetia bacterium]
MLDLQLNGYKGVDFNADDLSLDAMRRACAAVRADGGGRMLATIITDRLDAMAARIARLAAMHAADAEIRAVMAGIHVEGPFINASAGFVGAHPAAHVMPASPAAARRLLDAGGGLVRLLTLAPECDEGLATTRFLAREGVCVSAGHCDASREQLARAVDAGLAAFTHLGNGCPLSLHRHDNIIARVLALDGLRFVMVITDGVHVPPWVLASWIKQIGIERTVAVTDGTAAAGMTPGRYTLGGREVIVAADGAAWSPDRSHLVGSTATPADIRRILGDRLSLSEADIDRLTLLNPARMIGASP